MWFEISHAEAAEMLSLAYHIEFELAIAGSMPNSIPDNIVLGEN